MKVLMVDVDGVLVNGRPADGLPFATDLERDLGLPLAPLQREFFKPYWPDIVTGREPIEPRLTAVLANIAPHIETETLLGYWFANDSRLDKRLLEDLAELRKGGVALYLATNQEHRRAAWLMSELGLATHFDDIFYSAKLGHRKPDQNFFRLATAKAGVEPHEIMFIDDAAENIEGARQFGWNAVHWTPGMTLENALSVLHPTRL
ncbi:HAD-IA family hydrolase [Rhizobium sp. YS-1r]|jgi:putative hydrolase of the HAD superfamily|uniref:HAD-IA family hydrolase n=1 Tax=Neorhizobium phenanthreniclasticum TaxID=3157917 RepID=A0ABV0LWY8_9HYPH|nr:HAD-IA family hydrolase [Rhizobium sp. YS-1r]KGD86601.1 haloacid dehalogenase [Rhizobium sp. YS-1r]